ncbi:MAG: tRNA (adenosine(37)-N6)-threonylcarbamoyltransferase complex dimerization subunit type 1 TsaB [Deltaproteobacteria bacterium]|nr:tRNA (adenosine(37)-N6)-threonylcarbamoyltransferase complex dimerization subunit type 1 TsaB [Deltaproteobacteria bacterium]
MLTLAIDTSTNTAGVALLEGETICAEMLINLGMNHSVSLLPSINRIIMLAGITMADIDLYACTTGPGSFTGLRIGVSTVKGFSAATGKPVAGVSTLDALAFNFADSPLLICPMLDAKKKQVYTALYRGGSAGGIERICHDKAVAVEKFLPDIHEDCLFFGDGAFVYRDMIKKGLPAYARFGSPIQQQIRAAAVGHMGIRKFRANDLLDMLTFAPQYLRVSEAEAKI